jgi:cardiolipin synthase
MSRLFIISFSIVLQLGFLIAVVLLLSRRTLGVYLALQALSVVAVFGIITGRDNPSYKIPWVLTILSVPLVGGLFYLLWGHKRLPRSLKDRLDDFYYSTLIDITLDSGVDSELFHTDRQLGIQADYIRRVSGFPVWKNTEVEFFPTGDLKFARMLEELKKAEKFILLEYFIIRQGVMWDSVLDILKEKAAKGVEVMLMYDDLGCISTLPPDYHKTLRSFGIKVTVFNPFKPHLNLSMNYRDHRKICVIDGNTAFCGGNNLADEYINLRVLHGYWKDTAVMLRGDGVWNLTLMFLTLWHFSNIEGKIDYDKYCPTVSFPSDGFVQPFGDSPLDYYNVAENAYIQMISRATDYIYLTTPYLILDNEMLTSLTTAAESGVDVRIITPHIPDKWYVHAVSRSFYRQLIESGVKIYEYTPGFIHSKQFVSDDKIAIVGTTNMDFRSFYLHFECGVSFYRSSMSQKVKEDILNTIEVCQAVTYEDLLNQPLHRRLLTAVLKAFAPLM